MKIKTLVAVAIVDSSTGKLMSIPHGGIADISDELAESLIHDEIAEPYLLIEPSGTLEITENGTVDVTNYVSANVNVLDENFVKMINRGTTPDTPEGSDVEIVIPNGITVIGYQAFYYFENLTSITFPSSLTVIASHAFEHCTGLTTISIPSSVTMIGTDAWQDCTNLVSATIEATTPPVTDNDIFSRATSLTAIYVPAESVEAYKAATGWSNYASLIQAIPS